jgi:hypothetical protein
MQQPTAAQGSVEERVVVDQEEQEQADEETAASAILRAVQSSATLQLEDVLTSLRRSRCRLPSPSTTKDTVDPTSYADEHQPAERHTVPHELLSLWWWLFLSQDENACLAFLAGHGYDGPDNRGGGGGGGGGDDDDDDDDDEHQRQRHRGRREEREGEVITQREGTFGKGR